MAYTTINKSTDYFNTKLFTGNSSTNAITGVGFQPDWTWLKQRSHTYQHTLYDTTRTYATLKALGSDGNWAEGGGGDNEEEGQEEMMKKKVKKREALPASWLSLP